LAHVAAHAEGIAMAHGMLETGKQKKPGEISIPPGFAP
jgi:hypothetical protein